MIIFYLFRVLGLIKDMTICRVGWTKPLVHMNRSSEGTYFMSSETYEHLITILILSCSIGFNIILYFLMVNL